MHRRALLNVVGVTGSQNAWRSHLGVLRPVLSTVNWSEQRISSCVVWKETPGEVMSENGFCFNSKMLLWQQLNKELLCCTPWKERLSTFHISAAASFKSPNPISRSRGGVNSQKEKSQGELESMKRSKRGATWRKSWWGWGGGGGGIDKGKEMSNDIQEFCLCVFIYWAYAPGRRAPCE